MDCSRSHSVLTQCDFNGWGVHNCDHSEDVGVVCWPGSTKFFAQLKPFSISLNILFTDKYNVPVGGVRVLDTTGSSITVTWEVCELEYFDMINT